MATTFYSQEAQDALSFEQSNFVRGTCASDPFYDTPQHAASAEPGTLLKVEPNVDTSSYLLPPAIALSRVVYQSENLNGTLVPVSALILWPYNACRLPDGCPVVAWAHGTTGITRDSAPSHLKSIPQHFLAPYHIVLQGYVVVATDYAGLGVSKHYTGDAIVHEYLCGPTLANDVLYAVKAAQSGFEELSKKFVVIGHSQGGGAAWACAERQAHTPIEGFLGAVAVSPFTNVLDEPGRSADWYGVHACHTTAATESDFDISTVLADASVQFLSAVRELNAGIECARALFAALKQSRMALFKPGWRENAEIRKSQSIVSVGGKPIGCPLLVIHGDKDLALSIDVVTKAVEATAKLASPAHLSFAVLPQVTHNPAVLASHSVWAQWISDRLYGVEANGSFSRIIITPTRSSNFFQNDQNWYLTAATEFFHNAGDIAHKITSTQKL